MQVTFGKHAGKSVGYLILKEPDYLKWLLKQQNLEGPMAKVKVEAIRLISIFNSKPFIRKCEGENCQAPVSKYTTYKGSTSSLSYWCGKCDPYQSGAIMGKLSEHSTYDEAIRHIELTCGATKDGYRAIIRELAISKGLPKRSGESQIGAFFA